MMAKVEEYGIASFVYRSRRPFHPRRFHDVLSRSKVYCEAKVSSGWPVISGVWSQAGRVAFGFWRILVGRSSS